MCPVPEYVAAEAIALQLHDVLIVVHNRQAIVGTIGTFVGEQLRELQPSEDTLELGELQCPVVAHHLQDLLQGPVEAMQLATVQALPQLLFQDLAIGVHVDALINLLEVLVAEIEELLQEILTQVVKVRRVTLSAKSLGNLLNIVAQRRRTAVSNDLEPKVRSLLDLVQALLLQVALFLFHVRDDRIRRHLSARHRALPLSFHQCKF
mmetsp:Transcript_4626/g.9520  ORF Transcript_4626/g.9520 Transcript_4626/m.9520 type:complete len:207 (-) Transcript_4626:489-1109(-)